MRARFFACLLAVSCLLGLAGCKELIEKVVGGDKLEAAKSRVNIVLTGINKGGMSDELQLAICQWYKNANFINSLEELGDASDRFDDWQQSKGIFRNVKTWEILEAKEVEGADPFTAVVTVKINNRKHKMKVAEGRTIEWAR